MFQCSKYPGYKAGIEISCSQVSVGPYFSLWLSSLQHFFLLPPTSSHPTPSPRKELAQFHPASPQGSAPNSAGQELTAAPVEVYLLSPAPVPVANQRQHCQEPTCQRNPHTGNLNINQTVPWAGNVCVRRELEMSGQQSLGARCRSIVPAWEPGSREDVE